MNDITNALLRAVQNVYGDTHCTLELTYPDPQFGDIATNVAMQLAKKVAKNPREIAQEIVSQLPALSDSIESASVAGPGFINIKLAHSYYARLLQAVVEQKTDFGRNDMYKNKVVLVEYSDPNPFKPLHAGHLYTTLIGDVIARLIERAGATITRINYGGDVGPHVGKSMWAIIQELGGEYPEKLATIPEAERPTWLGTMYVRGNNAYETESSAKKEILHINKRVYALHAENDATTPFAQLYWTCRQWSYDYFAQLYTKLGVHAFDRFIPESEVAARGAQTVQEQLVKGVYAKSDGAIIFKGDEHGLHSRVFINSEGLPTYEAKEVGLLLTKWEDYAFDTSIVVTANEQAQYMEVVQKSIQQFAPEPVERSIHLTHGMVKLAGGVKMSSRKGNTIMALDILNEAARANKEATGKEEYSAVLAAVKYSFLRPRIGSDIAYDPSESVSIVGNSGPYLQYAHARAVSVLTKSSIPGAIDEGQQFSDGEITLLRELGKYEQVVLRATKEHMPHHICNYLYELAQIFNRFYEQNKVIGDEREAVRVLIVHAYTVVLKNGLSLLGITAPDSM